MPHLFEQVTAIAPLGEAIDGTRKTKRRRRARGGKRSLPRGRGTRADLIILDETSPPDTGGTP